MDSFGLVGRSSGIESVIAHVKEPGHCGSLIVGEAGMGKTAVAQAVSDALRVERPVFQISGTPALSTMPFGVLAPLLGGMEEAGREPSQDEVFRAVCGFFRGQRAKGGQVPLVVVDDAYDVDTDSRTILARLVVSDSARMLVLSPRSAMPLEFLELWTDGFLGRCDLRPLTPDEIHLLCERQLQGKVLRSVSAMLGDISKGNPLFVLALLRQSHANGSLFERNGVWLLSAAPSSYLPLLERLRGDLRRLSADELEVLEAVALAEPLPMDVLTHSGMVHVLDNLELLELVTVSDDPRCVRHANPLFSEALRRTVPPAHSSELRQKYAQSAEDMPNDRLIRHVSWALECGTPLPDRTLIRAVRAGNEQFDFQFSLRAAAAVQDSLHRDENFLEMAIAHAHLGHHLVARDLLQHLLQESTNLPVLFRAVQWIYRMPMHAGDSGQPRRLKTLLLSMAERTVGLRSGGPGDRDIDMLTRLVSILHHSAEGISVEAEEALARMAWSTPGINIPTRVASLSLLGELLNATGRFTSGRAATSLALNLVQEHPTELRMEFGYVFLHHVKGLLFGGQWREAAARLTDYRQDLSWNQIYFGAVLQLLEGTLAVQKGQVHSGLEQLRPAIEGLRFGPHSEYLPFGLGMMAYAAALCGEAALVDECVETFPQDVPYGDKGLYRVGEAYLTAAMAGTGRTDDAIQQLAELARHARSHGMLAAERDALALSMCIGDALSAVRLAELTSTLEGPISEVFHLYSCAVVSRDPDALMEAAARARHEGFHLVGVSGLEQAAAILEADADRGRRNRAQMLLRQYKAQLDGPVILSGHDSSRASRLTPREQEIVELAQRGQSNREIARILSLSARTVEGHLYRIFAKLGVSSRAELLISLAPPESLQA